MHLRPAGDSWHDIVPAILLGGVIRQVLHQKRPGSHQGHVSAKDIPKLRKFIETGLPQKPTGRRQPLPVLQPAPLSVVLACHSPKFQRGKGPPAQAGACLAEKNGRSEPEPDNAGHDRNQRRQDDQSRHDHKKVEQSLAVMDLWRGRAGTWAHIKVNVSTLRMDVR